MNLLTKSSIKTLGQLNLMRESGRVVAHAVRKALDSIEPGITTMEIDAIARADIESQGARPAFLGLYGFPATACISLNEEIVHGIPGNRVVQAGDLVSIDCGAIVEGMYSDMARSVVVEPSGNDAVKVSLCEVALLALDRGIEQIRPGNRVGDISFAIENHVRSVSSYDVVKEYVGHGVGFELHEPPQIPNFGKPNRGPVLASGMTLAVEPMVVEGQWQTRLLEDQWTVVTADGKLSAHFEDTIAVTPEGFEILTVMEQEGR